MRNVAVALLLVVAAHADAGHVFHYRETFENNFRSGTRGGRVWIEGERRRIELDPIDDVRTFDISLSEDGGRTETLVNNQNQTWFRSSDTSARPKDAKVQLGSSSLFHLPTFGDETVDKLKVDTAPDEIRFSYRLRGRASGYGISARVVAKLRRRVDRSIPARWRNGTFYTGIAEIDEKIRLWEASLDGLVVEEDVEITRTMDGGQPFRDRSHLIVDGVEAQRVDAKLFTVPAGYKYQVPQLGVPGR